MIQPRLGLESHSSPPGPSKNLKIHSSIIIEGSMTVKYGSFYKKYDTASLLYNIICINVCLV